VVRLQHLNSSMRVCVFGSSSTATNTKYVEAAVLLGELIAEKGLVCVNGAGKFGVMGGLNDGCSSKNGDIVGIIHSKFCVDFGEHKSIKKLEIVDGADLYQRKLRLFENSDCILVLPGGVGTFDELWDGVSAKSLGMKDMSNKPICVVNIDGYYDGSILQMRRAAADGILYKDVEAFFHVETNVQDALDWCIAELQKLEKTVELNSDSVAVDPQFRVVARRPAEAEAETKTALESSEVDSFADLQSFSKQVNLKEDAGDFSFRSSKSGKFTLSEKTNSTKCDSSGTTTISSLTFHTSIAASFTLGIVVGAVLVDRLTRR
jgi:uncharacterized protein (TIGR00730 family)